MTAGGTGLSGRRPGLLVVAALLSLAALLPGAARADTIFGLVDTGELYASGDGGASWTIRSTLPSHDAIALAAGASTTQLFLATESGAFYRSADAGMSWSAVGSVPASDIATMVSRLGTILLIARSGAVYSSDDDGATFTAVGSIPASDVVGSTWWGSHYAVTGAGAVYRSDDGGASWSAVGAVEGVRVVGMVALGGRLYALTSTGDVAKDDDGTGASWNFVASLSQSGMSALARRGVELLASTTSGETAASPDGSSWNWRGAIGQLSVRALGTDDPTTTDVPPGRDGHLFRFAPPWPNPARTHLALSFDLESAAMTTVDVFDTDGRLVARPIAGERIPAGRVTRIWRPTRLAPGRYYLSARVGRRNEIRSFVWLGGP